MVDGLPNMDDPRYAEAKDDLMVVLGASYSGMCSIIEYIYKLMVLSKRESIQYVL